MYNEKVINQLKNDGYFAVQFAVDNNPLAVIESLKSLGYSANFTGDMKSDKLTAKKIIYQLVGERSPKVASIFSTLNYLDNDTNSEEYTKGYRDYFLKSTSGAGLDSQTYANRSGFSFDGLMAGLGAGLMAYGATSAASAEVNKTAAQIEEDQKKADEAAKAKKKKTYWIVGISIVVVIAGVLIYIYWPKPKKS